MAKQQDYISNTKKVPHQIGDTDLYYIQVYDGNSNPINELMLHISEKFGLKLDDVMENTRREIEEFIELKLEDKSSNPEVEKLIDNLLIATTESVNRTDLLNKLKKIIKECSFNFEDGEVLKIRLEEIAEKCYTPRKNPYQWQIYIKKDSISYEEFVEQINNGEIPCIGNTSFLTSGKPTELDENENLVLTESNSGDYLSQFKNRGNLLINRYGEILFRGKDRAYIHECENGVYKLEEFERNKKTGKVINRKYNFLDSLGNRVTTIPLDPHNPNPQSLQIERTFFCKHHTHQFRSKKIYPIGYMEFKHDEATYFEDLIALAEENVKRKKKGVDPLMLTTAQNDIPAYANKRVNEIENEKHSLEKEYDLDKIDPKSYNKALKLLARETERIMNFMMKYYPEWDIEETISSYNNEGM